MNNNHQAESRIEAILQTAGVESDAAEKLKKTAGNNPALAKALGRLTEKDIAGISAILNDRDAVARLMATPKAQSIMRKLKDQSLR